jgi:phosphatidate cytidylyltransferase
MTGPAANIAASALMVCWVPLMAAFLGLLLLRPHGEWYLLATIALTVSNDIGAYAFGNRFGRTKLAPHASPAKTWEGFLGGLLTVVVLAALITARGGEFTVVSAVVFGAALVVAATLGDLVESLVKRDLGVKDLGAFIPGHGGVMDRMDGILFALPTAHLVLTLLGL